MLEDMRWSIRQQILFPLVGIVLVAVIVMTVVAAVAAARQSDAQILSHLDNVVATLDHPGFPLTKAVLEKLRGLTGAHFLACDKRHTVLASTLSGNERLPDALVRVASQSQFDLLSRQPRLQIDGVSFFAVKVEPRGNEVIDSLYILYPVESWSRARWTAAFPSLGVGLGGVFLTALAAGWISQRFGIRIMRLQRQVAVIASGDFSRIPEDGRHDELSELAQSVNSMSAQLATMQEAIRVNERDRLLSQLAGGLAHQLRNAVAGARMALQLHQKRCASAVSDQSLAVALRQLSLTETQIKGLLSLGRGCHQSRLECDLNSLIEEIALLLHPVCEHAHVRLTVQTSPQPVMVVAELESLRAAFLNMATNAVEAAGEKGEVIVATHAENRLAVVEIFDSGHGPTIAVAETLFDPFVTTKPEGVGLGLALSRQAALDHCGRVSWRRELEQTIFRFELPLAPVSEAPKRTASSVVVPDS